MSYNMNTLSRDELVELIKNGNDSHDNQIRVTEDGTIFLSQKVGAEDISGLRFRFETFDAGNRYVGPQAAEDDKYIEDQIDNVELLKRYLTGVHKRAAHHAQEVENVIYTLIGLLIRFKDDDKDFEVMESCGDLKNVLWVLINGKRYCFAYNYETKKIDMRTSTTRGDTIFKFDNNTDIKESKAFFESL